MLSYLFVWCVCARACTYILVLCCASTWRACAHHAAINMSQLHFGYARIIIYVDTEVFVHTYVCAYATMLFAYTHVYMRTCMHTCVHACMCACMYVHVRPGRIKRLVYLAIDLSAGAEDLYE